MNHEQIRELIHPYVDGELDLLAARETEQHLRNCPECRGIENALRDLRQTVANSQPAYRAPSRLRRNVRAALRREAQTAKTGFNFWPVLATGAACALAILGVFFFQTTRGSRSNTVVDEVIANHVRSLLAAHLVDVSSSDQHTVKPWFDGKIDFAPEVRDLSRDGFPLIGGRLDYLDGRTVVSLVYYRNKHPINVFIMPATRDRDGPPSAITRRGYNVLSWTHAGMKYWAVSDLNQPELRRLAELLAQ
ncbi:MAG TPA: anti-sigma factor [Candidatus Udaeobacter sp.]|nr:anti-sigma factor [Candidatus Udaeobacter sp.]